MYNHDLFVMVCFRQEMKQLATALDEERTIRINLQVSERW